MYRVVQRQETIGQTISEHFAWANQAEEVIEAAGYSIDDYYVEWKCVDCGEWYRVDKVHDCEYTAIEPEEWQLCPEPSTGDAKPRRTCPRASRERDSVRLTRPRQRRNTRATIVVGDSQQRRLVSKAIEVGIMVKVRPLGYDSGRVAVTVYGSRRKVQFIVGYVAGMNS